MRNTRYATFRLEVHEHVLEYARESETAKVENENVGREIKGDGAELTRVASSVFAGG
jgi:hypothetical protein